MCWLIRLTSRRVAAEKGRTRQSIHQIVFHFALRNVLPPFFPGDPLFGEGLARKASR